MDNYKLCFADWKDDRVNLVLILNYMVNSQQISSISSLVIDLGKILFGSGVVGFFIPNTNIPVETFVIAIAVSSVLFFTGVIILKK